MTRPAIKIGSLHTTRNPMTEARRQHVHGPLVTLAQQAREAGEPSWLAGSLTVIGVFVVGVAALWFWEVVL